MKFDDLQRVNHSFNSSITYQSDDRVHRVSERWENAREFGYQGDCEDFALAKLEELLRRGWPIEQLRLCFCWVDREAEDSGHAVLIVEHEGRLWCLDNRYNQIREVTDCEDYVWNTIQAVGGSDIWVGCRAVFSKFYDSTLPPE